MSSREEIDLYQVHTFTERAHGGSPAGVCVSKTALSEAAMRAIAIDLGPSVTGFVHEVESDLLDLRWFTREGREVVSFCGHATFGSAHVMLHHRRPNARALRFSTISGQREVQRQGDFLTMAAPAWTLEQGPCPDSVLRAVGQAPEAYFKGDRDLLLTYLDTEALRALKPDFVAMLDLGMTGVIATSPNGEGAFAFRFFCPGFRIGENEDPATGSAMSTLGPFWRARLATPRLRAIQLSERGAEFECDVTDDAVLVRSRCVTFLTGRLGDNP